MPFSQIIPPLPSPTESNNLFFTLSRAAVHRLFIVVASVVEYRL